MDVELQQLFTQSRSWTVTAKKALLQLASELVKEDRELIAKTFELELPDPNQDLFIETWRNTTIFHPFPRFPIELRLRIWQETFPKAREVDISYKFYDNYDLDGPRPKWNFDSLPIALSINRESRAETRAWYCVHLSKQHERPVRPLWFNPLKDAIYLYYPDILASNLGSEYFLLVAKHLEALKYDAAAFVGKITEIKVRLRTLRYNRDLSMDHYSTALMHFPSLRRVILVPSIWQERDVELHIQSLQKYLNGYEKDFKSGKAPEVVYVVDTS